MGMLDRYVKPGGFFQLLSLLESFGPQKQEKFFGMIEEESPVWAEALRGKTITLQRLFSWDSQTLSLITQRVPPKNLSVVLKNLESEQSEKVFELMSHAERRRLDEEASLHPDPTLGEISAAQVKLIATARSMLKDGEIRAEHIDEELIVEDGIEQLLKAATSLFQGGDNGGGIPPAKVEPSSSEQNEKPSNPEVITSAAGNSVDVNTLQAKVLQLERENRAMKQEMKAQKEKLEGIRKLAS